MTGAVLFILVLAVSCGGTGAGGEEEDGGLWFARHDNGTGGPTDLEAESRPDDFVEQDLEPTVCTPGADCDDGDPCTFGDHCDAESECVGTMYACDDPYDCTVDVCIGDGTCSNELADEACMIDGVCYVAGQPKPGTYCQACVPEESQDGWTGEEGGECNDTNVCTDNDTCVAGVCKGTAMDCDDGNPCTDDSCSPANGCVNTPFDGPCDDGDPCTDGETCSGGVCGGGLDVCGIACAVDGDCVPEEDGDLCNGTLHCNLDLESPACVVDPATIVVCPTNNDTDCLKAQCQPGTGLCTMVNVADGTECDDGKVCTEGDQCLDGLCEGTAIPGCGITGTILSEGFEGDFPPEGWSLQMTGAWDFEHSPHAHNGSFSAYHNMSQSDARLITPPLDLEHVATVELTFWQEMWEAMQQTLYAVEVSTDGGITWSAPIYTGPQGTNDWEEVVVDLSAWSGSTIQLAWHYVASDLFTPPGKWYIDDVLVYGEQ